MKPFTYHTHSTFCDGRDTLPEMARAAYEAGVDSLGLACHSFVSHDPIGCIAPERQGKFEYETRKLQNIYAPMGMDIFLGIEQDSMSMPLTTPNVYDYIIGSMHYLNVDGVPVTIDSKKSFFFNLEKYFCNDALAFSLEYYRCMKDIYELTGCHIVGHFDIVTKFNEGGCLFDEKNSRYEKSAEETIEVLARKGLIFEINTGSMARGYRSEPYPSRRLLSMIREVGGKVTYASDCHDAPMITYGFDHAQRLALECGFDHLMKLRRTQDVCEFYPAEIEVSK